MKVLDEHIQNLQLSAKDGQLWKTYQKLL